ncbi:hypothetical protein FRC04_010940 [Tulasnella sp. 424]|nr:hypothetical protein FRC04_010940 [Tulasnella sp. 424]KAG8975698.1 hypothetical protein FRC05_005216 [Tulasnella sp. 425]
MGDDERAAKAARAKALLKSHQKKKKVGASVPSNLSHLAGSSQGPPSVASASALFSTEGSEVPDDRSEFGGAADRPTPTDSPKVPPSGLSPSPSVANGISALASKAPAVKPATPSSFYPPNGVSSTPPQLPTEPSTPTHPPAPAEPPVNVAVLKATIQDQQETISFLVQEKNSLAASLEHLGELEQKSQQNEGLIEEQRQSIERLTTELGELQRSQAENLQRATRLQESETQLQDKVQAVERELELTKRNASDLKAQLTQQRARVKQLEDQIESDDRVEQMEKSMKGIQDRAESLEFQLSKVKQAHAQVKSERDGFEKQLSERTSVEAEWKAKHDTLSTSLQESQDSVANLTAEHDRLKADNSKLQTQNNTTQQSLLTLQNRLVQLTSDHQHATRHLTSTQSELTAAGKRVSQAEETVKNLQKENTQLMENLEEMRAKVVELNGDKMELAERVDSLGRTVKSRDETIAALEATVEQSNAKLAEVQAEHSKTLQQLSKEKAELERSGVEQQDGYTALQTELEESQKAVKELTADRTALRSQIHQVESEFGRLRETHEALQSEKETLRQELDDRAKGGDEVAAMLQNTREEIESLRTDLSLKDEELLRTKALLEEANLRASRLNSPVAASHTNLNEEMMEAQSQQHALELSTAQSQIRTLETNLFQEQAKTHSLQRRITTLEGELHMTKMQAAATAPHKPGSPRTSTINNLRRVSSPTPQRNSGELQRRAVSSTFRPVTQIPVIDSSLSAEIRHKRKISLSMLKARIDSEMALKVPLALTPSTVGTPRLGTLSELNESSPKPNKKAAQLPQFGDETHVFCCAACQGDLVVL